MYICYIKVCIIQRNPNDSIPINFEFVELFEIWNIYRLINDVLCFKFLLAHFFLIFFYLLINSMGMIYDTSTFCIYYHQSLIVWAITKRSILSKLRLSDQYFLSSILIADNLQYQGCVKLFVFQLTDFGLED